MRLTRRRAQVRRVQSPRLRPQTGTWIGGAKAVEMVELEGESRGSVVVVVVLAGAVSRKEKIEEGMVRQDVGDVSMKVTAVEMRVDIEKCMFA